MSAPFVNIAHSGSNIEQASKSPPNKAYHSWS